MSQLTVGFIGLGLIGGSIGKALKKQDNTIKIIAYDTNLDSLLLAKKEGIIEEYTNAIDLSFAKCDFIFLCAPVQKNDQNLAQLKSIISTSCIITDVGSVKTNIHEEVIRLNLDNQFIGGHPMAGSERTGYVNSKASLLENAYYILSPASNVAIEKIKYYKILVEKMGAIPLILDYQQHDYVTAAISHLPHVISAALVKLVRDSDSSDGIMKMLAAGGFKDITRIASSSATMWQQICLTNTDNILELLDAYISSLNQIKKDLTLKKDDALFDFFENARIYRDSFINTSSGPIKCSYCITIDIVDKPGSLATIATLLAHNNINIKNIGIVHNREKEEGALEIEFYSEKCLMQGKKILANNGYLIYERHI